MKKMKGLLQKNIGRLNLGLLAMLLAILQASHATTIETILNKTHQYLSGSVAHSLALVAIMISGYLCVVRQKFPKEAFAMTLLGFGVIFGANSLYSTLIG